jgi:hypothetical protein
MLVHKTRGNNKEKEEEKKNSLSRPYHQFSANAHPITWKSLMCRSQHYHISRRLIFKRCYMCLLNGTGISYLSKSGELVKTRNPGLEPDRLSGWV